jgi:hypothetical protein
MGDLQYSGNTLNPANGTFRREKKMYVIRRREAMKRLKPLLAICLILALALSSSTPVWAVTRDPLDAGDTNPVDSGHPWDDEAGEQTGDPDDPGDPTTTAIRHYSTPYSTPYRAPYRIGLMVTTTSRNNWLGNAVFYLWQRIAVMRLF